MTFSIFGGECAPAILDRHPAVEPDISPLDAAAGDLVCLVGLDRLPSDRRLVCRWNREPDGRIACHWEPDIVPDPQR